jgi:thioredoxin 1
MAKKSFNELINNPDTPVLVDFYADWCGPCKTMSPIVEQVASQYNGKVKVIKVNVDSNQAAAAQYRVQGVPTFILFRQGQQVWRQSGAMPANVLAQAIQQHVQ